MAYREFLDRHGTAWKAWAVIPRSAERRGEADRRLDSREQGERRTRHEVRIQMDDDIARGWLAFESAEQNRRLRPIPEGWEDLPDDELVALCERAELVSSGTPRHRE